MTGAITWGKHKKTKKSECCAYRGGGSYLLRPSSVRSTLMMKNMKPRAPSFCPPTSVFTQPLEYIQKGRMVY